MERVNQIVWVLRVFTKHGLAMEIEPVLANVAEPSPE